MNEKQRVEFEKWAKQKGYNLDRWDAVLYDCWMDAIASVVVDLPTLIIDEYENGETLEYVEMSELKESLEKAGVRYE